MATGFSSSSSFSHEVLSYVLNNTAQKMKFFMKDFFSKYDQIIFCAVMVSIAGVNLKSSEAATRRCSLEKVFRKYAANLQENTHAEVRFQ